MPFMNNVYIQCVKLPFNSSVVQPRINNQSQGSPKLKKKENFLYQLQHL